MNETMIILWATGVALFMATLNAQNVSPDLIAAVRTTIVIILGWSFACCRYGFRAWAELAWPMRYMLIFSAVAVVLAWLFYLRASHKQTVLRVAVMDRVNVGFAALFTALFLWQRTSMQSAVIGFGLVGGSLFLAFSKR